METHTDTPPDAHHYDETVHARTSLNRTAFLATAHCLTGCAIGEVLAMVIASAAGLGNALSIAIAVALAFAFGYAFTMVPLLESGLALAVVIPLALASDTLSIATMEIVDNALSCSSHTQSMPNWATASSGGASGSASSSPSPPPSP